MGAAQYAFLLDENIMHLKPLFPKGRAKTISDFDMAGASDRDVMRLAFEEQRVLWTANGDDFLEEYARFVARGTDAKCMDLYGLVLVPGHRSGQLGATRDALRAELTFNGRHIGWADVLRANLLVRANGRRPRVEALPRCPGCVRPRP